MISVSKLRQRARENGWTKPSTLVSPVVITTVILGFSIWRNGFDGSARAWAGTVIVWVLGVFITWFLFTVCMPKRWRDMGL